MVALDDIKRLDCRDVIERDIGAPKKRGAKESRWPCPLHGGTNANFAVWDTGWKCWSKCDKGGDVISWTMEWHGVDFKGAVERLGGPNPLTPTPPLRLRGRGGTMGMTRHAPTELPIPPDDVWQARAWMVMIQAERMLWSAEGERALEYLVATRGLTHDIIREARLGYIPGGPREWKKMEGLNVPCGITIPWLIERPLSKSDHEGHDTSCPYTVDLWQLKVRRAAGKTKYEQVKGGTTGGIYRVDTARDGEPVLIDEGELNALAVAQCGLAGLALGCSGNAGALGSWIERLFFAGAVYARLDDDAAGHKALAKMQMLTERIIPVSVPGGFKDPNEFLLADGVGFREWVEELKSE